MTKYYSTENLIAFMDEPYKSICLRIYRDNLELFKQARGSTHLHQAWTGGYDDHICEVMNIAVAQYSGLASLRPLPFTLSDALLVLYLHDIEKPWKYEIINGTIQRKSELTDKKAQREFRDKKIAEYGLVLNPVQQNALEHVEGEIHDYNNEHRAMNELAAFCHLCDVVSARIWYDFPKKDPWLLNNSK